MSLRAAAAIWALLCAVVGVLIGVAASIAVGVGVAVVLFFGPVIAYWRWVDSQPLGRRR